VEAQDKEKAQKKIEDFLQKMLDQGEILDFEIS
jgi:hypothetical protein